MSILVWLMTGIAIWHFAVFVPDRFWGGIVGAFVMAALGSLAFGFALVAVGLAEMNDPNLVTMLQAVVGGAGGLSISYWIGSRRDSPYET